MWAYFVIQPAVIALAAGAGWLVCRTAHLPEYGDSMRLAAVVCLVAAELALMPLVLTRGASQLGVSQAGLVSTMVHLFLAAGLGWLISSAKHLGNGFSYWMLVFYFVTLVSTATAAIGAIRKAPVHNAGPGAGDSKEV